MGWNERSDPDMRTANFKFSCDVYREGVYRRSHYCCLVTLLSRPGLANRDSGAPGGSVARLGGLPPNWASFDRLGPENNALGG